MEFGIFLAEYLHIKVQNLNFLFWFFWLVLFVVLLMATQHFFYKLHNNAIFIVWMLWKTYFHHFGQNLVLRNGISPISPSALQCVWLQQQQWAALTPNTRVNSFLPIDGSPLPLRFHEIFWVGSQVHKHRALNLYDKFRAWSWAS